jgi:Ser/Thr protein kinase RdoA (MazF antagonist)
VISVPDEEMLDGGNASGLVIRVGPTVRKPAGPQTPAVEALLSHLDNAGFTGSPRTLGRDKQGRHVLEYVPGQLADTLPPLDTDDLHRVGGLIRELHDKAAGFEPPPGARWDVVIPPDRRDLICHHDLAPWNLVLGADRWVFIDWDGAGPGSRLWDLAYAAKGFVPLVPDGDPAADAPRLRALADGYGLDAAQRGNLPALVAAHTRGMFDLLREASLTGSQPWARLDAAGHGEDWGQSAAYVEQHLGAWIRALR